ncbi:MAG: hypothetical protein QHH18_02120 [Candidatus Bathyarchaeota archaeon]|jgi:uncharacterized membrane protein|nr:hypothetical protein [Candidatus Bathyarchaeota archaeon A05DMB-5]MDH7557389.1 hypothetical protein [Candidatus Bathyarchaeota archaeon]
MGRAALTTPLYISVAWTLMISYQIFTQTAVTTLISYVNLLWPSVGSWLSSRMDMLTFIYAFAWVFVLSSVIPSVILGKERSVLVQFLVCLTLALVALIIQDVITTYASGLNDHLFSLSSLFYNPFLAVGYLIAPFIVMLAIDIRSRRKRKKTEELDKVTEAYLKNMTPLEENAK